MEFYADLVIFADIPLIYVLIGGSINAFGFVERALANGIPVIIAVVSSYKSQAIILLYSRDQVIIALN